MKRLCCALGLNFVAASRRAGGRSGQHGSVRERPHARGHCAARAEAQGRPCLHRPANLEDKEWILRLNRFRRVEMETRPSARPGRKTLMVLVQEKGLWSFDPF